MEDSFSQKNRKRAIAITNIAILKVPLTKLNGFDKEQNSFIRTCNQKVLKEAKELNKVKSSTEMEVGMLIDLHTWEDPLVVKGKVPRKVDMQDEPKLLEKVDCGYKNQFLFIHNHPSTGTFSGEDLKTFCNHDSLYMAIVVGNDGSVYVLYKEFSFNKTDVLEYYGELCKYYSENGFENNGTMAMHELLKKASLYGLNYKKGRKWI